MLELTISCTVLGSEKKDENEELSGKAESGGKKEIKQCQLKRGLQREISFKDRPTLFLSSVLLVVYLTFIR